LFGKDTENGTKKPSAKPGNRVPRVKVLNYLKKVALFFRFERDILADGAQVIGLIRQVQFLPMQMLISMTAMFRYLKISELDKILENN